MQRSFGVVNKWARWPDLLYGNTFFKKACSVIHEEDTFSDYCLETGEKLDLPSFKPEQILALEALVSLMGGPTRIDPLLPEYEGTGARYLMYIIRDALIFLGLMPQATEEARNRVLQ
jgi:hypothetical protein